MPGQFQYGHHNVSWAHDIVPDTFNCASCHTDTPHASSTNQLKDSLDSHTPYIACQTCHIKQTGGLVYRDLTEPIEPVDDAHFYSFNDRVQYGLENLNTAGLTVRPAGGKVSLRDPARLVHGAASGATGPVTAQK